MAIDPAAISASPAVTMTLVRSTAPESPAAKAKGTVSPSDIPMTMSRTVSPAVKCFSMWGVCGMPPPVGFRAKRKCLPILPANRDARCARVVSDRGEELRHRPGPAARVRMRASHVGHQDDGTRARGSGPAAAGRGEASHEKALDRWPVRGQLDGGDDPG